MGNQYPQRKSIRLPGYNYGSQGYYFVTVCAFGRKESLGIIKNGEVWLSNWGKIVEESWYQTPEVRTNVVLDAFVVMPNHIHGIVVIDNGEVNDTEGGYDSGGVYNTPLRRDVLHTSTGLRSPSQTLGAIVRGFKGAVTSRIKKEKAYGEFSFWQRNYYEHIVRNEQSLNSIREYIVSNPFKWDDDVENLRWYRRQVEELRNDPRWLRRTIEDYYERVIFG